MIPRAVPPNQAAAVGQAGKSLINASKQTGNKKNPTNLFADGGHGSSLSIGLLRTLAPFSQSQDNKNKKKKTKAEGRPRLISPFSPDHPSTFLHLLKLIKDCVSFITLRARS